MKTVAINNVNRRDTFESCGCNEFTTEARRHRENGAVGEGLGLGWPDVLLQPVGRVRIELLKLL